MESFGPIKSDGRKANPKLRIVSPPESRQVKPDRSNFFGLYSIALWASSTSHFLGLYTIAFLFTSTSHLLGLYSTSAWTNYTSHVTIDMPLGMWLGVTHLRIIPVGRDKLTTGSDAIKDWHWTSPSNVWARFRGPSLCVCVPLRVGSHTCLLYEIECAICPRHTKYANHESGKHLQ